MIACIIADNKRAVEISPDDCMRFIAWRAGYYLYAILSEESRSPLPHAAGDNDGGAAFMQPPRQKPGLMLGRSHHIGPRDLFGGRVHINQSELVAMPEVRAQSSFRHWNCNSHLFLLFHLTNKL
jgi:hypothetical protein